MNKKYKYLTKNIGLFTISSFGPKILSFLMVPLYTACLSTSEYGVADIITTTVNFALPILIACIDNGVLRFSLDKAYDTRAVYSNSVVVLLRGLLIGIALSAVAVALPLPFDWTYILFFLLYLVANAAYNFQSVFCRGIDKLGVMVEMSLITTGASCLLNILFLPVLNLGVNGYMIANFAGTYLAVIWGTIRLKAWRYFDKSTLAPSLTKEILSYSIPMIFNQIGWWVNNSIDKYVVVGMLGTSENGILSVSYKIPTILSTVGGVFAGAFSLSAIKEFDPEDSDGFIINMYNLYNAALVICCAGIVILNVPLARLLYSGDFFVAWRYTGPLLISVVFGSLAGFLGCICDAVKDTKIYAFSTIVGGVVNVLFSVMFIERIGAMSVVIGTAISNVIIWLIRLLRCRKHIKLRINYLRDIFVYVLLVAMFVIGLGGFHVVTVSVQVVLLGTIVLLNRGLILQIFSIVKQKIKPGNGASRE